MCRIEYIPERQESINDSQMKRVDLQEYTITCKILHEAWCSKLSGDREVLTCAPAFSCLLQEDKLEDL